MNFKKNNFVGEIIKTSALVASFSALLVACGKAPAGPAPAAPVGTTITNTVAAVPCTGGQFRVNGSCVTCAAVGGYPVTSGTTQLCRLDRTFQSSFWSYGSNIVYSSSFPILNDSIPANPTAATAGIPVFQGDKLSVTATGGWGSTQPSVNSYLGGLISTYSWGNNCSDIDLNGKQGSTQITYRGQPAGLVASDGKKTYSLANNATATILNNGTLFIGFNSPMETIMSTCGSLSVSKVSLTRCVDASGTGLNCP